MELWKILATIITIFIVVTIAVTTTEDTVTEERNKTSFEQYVGGSTIEEIRHNQNVSVLETEEVTQNE